MLFDGINSYKYELFVAGGVWGMVIVFEQSDMAIVGAPMTCRYISV